MRSKDGLGLQSTKGSTTSFCSISKWSNRGTKWEKRGIWVFALWLSRLLTMSGANKRKLQEHSPQRCKNQRTHRLNAGHHKPNEAFSLTSHSSAQPRQPALHHPAFTPDCFLGSNTKPLCSNALRGRLGICCQLTTLAVLLSRNNDRHVFLKSALLIFSDKNWSTAERILAAIKPNAFEFPLKLYCSFYDFI